jgi:hypothetical protein
MRWERLWWCLPVIVLSEADGLLTLWGQPESYWTDGYTNINEYNPLAAWFLRLHPLAFAASGVPYLILVIALVLWLPRRWAVLAAVVLAATHALGVIVWCRILFAQPALALTPMALVVIALGVLACQRGRDRRADSTAAVGGVKTKS